MTTKTESAEAVLNHMIQVAFDAETRAAELREFANMYLDALHGKTEGTDPDQIEAFMHSMSFFDQAHEKVDEVAHVHSGSTHGSNVRRANRALAQMLAGETVTGW